ncbi:DUF1826 domain-containing protein [Siccirubricoccus phaeus]|uniref:DUF1826 domain-containing protein n=1 Tax=Siccirubricoccus phaeus TaxID=2595053 RepID=UPI0011F31E23|nr:DUF1826 domain-containing protein [Siccirubricoccus phaeus]
MSGLVLECFSAASLLPPPHPGAPTRYQGACVSGASPEVLADILRPECNLAIWHRTLPRRLRTGLRPLLAAAPFSVSAEGELEAALTVLTEALPAPPGFELLQDIAQLALFFAALAETGEAVRLRLEGITGPACHRWHADAVGLRLLCTYCGPGTEFLPLAGGAEAARALDPAALPCPAGRVATGAAALLKGEAYPGNAGFGCLHRSPPAGAGPRARLLLCLDEPGRIPPE